MCFPKALDLPLHIYPHKRDRSSELKYIIFKLTCKSKHNALCKHAVSLYSTLTKQQLLVQPDKQRLYKERSNPVHNCAIQFNSNPRVSTPLGIEYPTGHSQNTEIKIKDLSILLFPLEATGFIKIIGSIQLYFALQSLANSQKKAHAKPLQFMVRTKVALLLSPSCAETDFALSSLITTSNLKEDIALMPSAHQCRHY